MERNWVHSVSSFMRSKICGLISRFKKLSGVGWEHMSERARKAFYDAVSIARQKGHQQVEPEHLLMAILSQDDSVAHRIVGRFAEVEAVLLELAEYLSEAPPTRAAVSEVRLSARSRSVVLRALKQATESPDNWVGTYHLLYGIVSERNGFAAQVLLRRGLSPEVVIHSLS